MSGTTSNVIRVGLPKPLGLTAYHYLLQVLDTKLQDVLHAGYWSHFGEILFFLFFHFGIVCLPCTIICWKYLISFGFHRNSLLTVLLESQRLCTWTF